MTVIIAVTVMSTNTAKPSPPLSLSQRPSRRSRENHQQSISSSTLTRRLLMKEPRHPSDAFFDRRVPGQQQGWCAGHHDFQTFTARACRSLVWGLGASKQCFKHYAGWQLCVCVCVDPKVWNTPAIFQFRLYIIWELFLWSLPFQPWKIISHPSDGGSRSHKEASMHHTIVALPDG